MNDEGIGIAGWLFADLMLVLALVFVAVGSEDDAQLDEERAAHSETQRALDEERAAHAETQDALDDERTARAEAQDALDEERAARTEAQDALDDERAARAETQDALDEERAAHERTRACLYELDFRFDQIVLRDMALGSVTETDIWNGYARENVEKSYEGARWEPSPTTSRTRTLLDKRFNSGFRIGLVETYSHDRSGAPGADVPLSREVNDALFATLEDHYFTDDDRGIVRDNRTGAYLWRTFALGEVRINLLFVKPPGEDCE